LDGEDDRTPTRTPSAWMTALISLPVPVPFSE
jgi:hypothetical protein